MSPNVTQKSATAVCDTPTTSRNVKTPTTGTTVGKSDFIQGTPRNSTTKVIPKSIEDTPINNASTPETADSRVTPNRTKSNEITTPRNTRPISGNDEVTPRNTASKEITLVAKRKRPQPNYHELNVKRTKVTVNSKIKKKK